MTQVLFFLAFGFLVSVILTPWMIRLAHAGVGLDVPDEGRKQQASPIPRIGGVPLMFSLVLGVIVILWLQPDLRLRVRAVLANDDEAGVATLLQAEGCTLGLSDAGAHVGQLCDAPLATDLLGKWVREKGVLTLENAVNKLTKVQADLFGFADRGELRAGFAADIVVFDPATVAPGPLRRVRDFPADAERLTADQPVGMRHLLVNGTPVIVDGALSQAAVDQRPGELLRPAKRR